MEHEISITKRKKQLDRLISSPGSLKTKEKKKTIEENNETL